MKSLYTIVNRRRYSVNHIQWNTCDWRKQYSAIHWEYSNWQCKLLHFMEFYIHFSLKRILSHKHEIKDNCKAIFTNWNIRAASPFRTKQRINASLQAYTNTDVGAIVAKLPTTSTNSRHHNAHKWHHRVMHGTSAPTRLSALNPPRYGAIFYSKAKYKRYIHVC